MKSYIKDYPRPQLVRRSWTNLNGSWSFRFDDEDCGESREWYVTFPEDHREIQVPFTYETKLGGIGETEHHAQVWYERTVEVAQTELEGRRVLLHFEGSDFVTKLWVNGVYVGLHRGGYARFTFDITRYLHAGQNRLTVKAEDSMSIEQPRGKQRWMKDSFGCWYVQTTGIWKTVWMESVAEVYLAGLKLTPDVENHQIRIEYSVESCIGDTPSDVAAGVGGQRPAGAKSGDSQRPAGAESEAGRWSIEAEIEYDGVQINRSSKALTGGTVEDVVSVFRPDVTPWGVYRWTPAHPELYDLTIRILRDGEVVDEVFSYFGMREIRIEAGNILLNGEPLYQRLILDQGYWEDSHLTPPSEEALVDDIDKLLAMGYNGVRKHMKIEDERFLYWCDVKGLLVWSEMAATYAFNDNAVQEFTTEWMEIVRQNYSHPCIITWTPFNESWGVPQIKINQKQQDFTQAIYYLTKSMDSMRPVIVNDGWEHTISDIITLHDYEEDGEVFFERYAEHLEKLMSSEIYHSQFKSSMAEGFAYAGQPIIISEYGGIAFSGGKEGDWGYGNTVSTQEEFLARFDRITTAIKRIPYITGYCYTQVSDVQQEINGLLDAGHEYKLPPEKIRAINCKEAGLRRINCEQ